MKIKTFTFLFLILVLAISTNAQTSSWFDQYIRRIHMDFHTPEFESDIAIKKFDAKTYVKTLKDANVNSLVTFAKGHHGNSYYNTKIGHKHSGLPAETDMLGEIIDECHNNDMKVLVYYSVGWLTPIEREKPEWMERNIEGNKMGTDGTTRTESWNCICLNSPYMEEIVLPELQEISANYNLDGVWIDIIENNPCYCDWCKAKYKKAYGTEYPNHAAAKAFAGRTRYEAVEKMVNTVKKEKPNAPVSYNTAGRYPELVPLVDYLSIETHPGATWHQGAWTHALLTMKYLQQFNKPWESTTSRFIHGWGGWDDQTTENMLAVASRITANGGVINLGDQTYPSGELDAEIYKKIGKVYTKIKKMEPWAINAKSIKNIGILSTEFDIYSIYSDPAGLDKYLGAAKILSNKHWHFDFLLETNLPKLMDYKCIVLPNIGELQSETVSALKKYVQEGGKLIITGNSSFSEKQKEFQLAEEMGISFQNMSSFSVGYLKLEESISDGIRKSPLLTPGHFFEIKNKQGAKVLSQHIYPIFQPKPEELFFFRNGQFSPPGKTSESPGIVWNQYGKGEVIYVAAPIFEIYMNQSQWYLKDVATNLLQHLNIENAVELHSPENVEMYLMEKDNHLVVNLVNYHLHNETNQVEEVFPLYNIELRIDKSMLLNSELKVIGENKNFELKEEGNNYIIKLEELQTYSQIIFKLRRLNND